MMVDKKKALISLLQLCKSAAIILTTPIIYLKVQKVSYICLVRGIIALLFVLQFLIDVTNYQNANMIRFPCTGINMCPIMCLYENTYSLYMPNPEIPYRKQL